MESEIAKKIFLVSIGVSRKTFKKIKASSVYEAQLLARKNLPFRFSDSWWNLVWSDHLICDTEASFVEAHKEYQGGHYFVEFEQRVLGVFAVPADTAIEARKIFRDWLKNSRRKEVEELGFDVDSNRIIFCYEVKPFLPEWGYSNFRIVLPVPYKVAYRAAWNEFAELCQEKKTCSTKY